MPTFIFRLMGARPACAVDMTDEERAIMIRVGKMLAGFVRSKVRSRGFEAPVERTDAPAERGA